jgi:putative tricarboxylic transport membrane protein
MTRDLVGGILAILIGASYFAFALQIRASSLADGVGPAGLPKVLGILMIGLGIVLCAQALLSARRRALPLPADARVAGDSDSDDALRRSGLAGPARAGGLLAIGIVYLLIVRTVGYVPAIAVLIITAALYGGAAPGWRVVAIGLAGAIFYYVLFVLVLGIPLPAGDLLSFLLVR